MRRSILLVLILAVAGVALLADAVPAQAQPKGELAAALKRLGEELRTVGRIIVSLNHPQAVKLLRQAEQLRDEAIAAIQQREFQVARGKIKLAFSLLRQATKLSLEGPVQRLRNRMEEVIRRAENALVECGNKEAERSLRLARTNQQAAERAFQAQEIIKAVEHGRIAMQFARTALDLCGDEASNVTDDLADARQRFETLKERAREVVESSDAAAARQIYNQALKLAESAREAWRNRNFKLARTLFNQSMLLLLRVLDMGEGAPGMQMAGSGELRLIRLKERIEEVREAVAESRNPAVRVLFERAVDFTREAENALARNRQAQATQKLNVAENMLRRAYDLALGRAEVDLSSKLAGEIERAKRDLEEVRAEAAQSSSADVEVLTNMATFAIQRAEGAHRAGFERVALEGLLAAQRFLSRAEQLLRSPDSGEVPQEALGVRLQQLNEALHEAERRVSESGDRWGAQLLENAREIQRMAQTSYQEGNYQAADAGIQVAFELVRKSLSNIIEE